MKRLTSLVWINDRIKECRCKPELLLSYGKAGPKISSLIRKAGMHIVQKAFHQFDRGYTCVWLLRQSHVSLHSWPEYNFITVNIEVCNFKKSDALNADHLHAGLLALFKPKFSSPKKFRMKLGEKSFSRQGRSPLYTPRKKRSGR